MNSDRFPPVGRVGGLRLLPVKDLITTGPVDHADWNYKPVLGWIERQRFKLALFMIPARTRGAVLGAPWPGCASAPGRGDATTARLRNRGDTGEGNRRGDAL